MHVSMDADGLPLKKLTNILVSFSGVICVGERGIKNKFLCVSNYIYSLSVLKPFVPYVFFGNIQTIKKNKHL